MSNTVNVTNNTANTANLPSKTIYCYRSNVPLANVTAICSMGWPLLSSIQTTLLHPIYSFPLPKLIVNMTELLREADSAEWLLTDGALLSIRLHMSAIMYELDAIWRAPAESNQHVASLPAVHIAVGCAARLNKLASWYHVAASKKLAMPTYRVSKHNQNMEWQNLSAWLEDAEQTIEDWRTGADRLKTADELRKHEQALLTVKAENVYKRIDLNKVWNWIDIQMAQDTRYPAGRRTTFKTIFMRGDIAPEDWTTDDIDDIVEAILNTCDIGNEISHFITTRLSHIRALIIDFYSSFTLLSNVSSEGVAHPDMLVTEQEAKFFADFDRRAESLADLPPEPKRESFASQALYLKAKAQHNILTKRFANKTTG